MKNREVTFMIMSAVNLMGINALQLQKCNVVVFYKIGCTTER